MAEGGRERALPKRRRRAEGEAQAQWKPCAAGRCRQPHAVAPHLMEGGQPNKGGEHVLLQAQQRTRAAVAIVAATPAQFSELIKFTTYGTYSLANYTNYGCHCGSNTQGLPVDETDWCCHDHACCYNKALMKGCVPETTTYRYYTYKDQIKCVKTNMKCDKEVCECDEEAADCFRKRLHSYNLHFLNMTNLPSCRGARPFC